MKFEIYFKTARVILKLWKLPKRRYAPFLAHYYKCDVFSAISNTNFESFFYTDLPKRFALLTCEVFVAKYFD